MMSRGRDLRAYLERHILTGLDPLTAEVMLAGALLPRLIFPRDEEYLPGAPGEAEAALEQLVARGFLVTRSGRRSYTVHPLVRAYAERQAWSSDEGAAAVTRAAAHLESIGEHHRAASLYLRAGRFDDAARPLRTLALSSLNAVVDFAHERLGGPSARRRRRDRPAPGWWPPRPGCSSSRPSTRRPRRLYERAARSAGRRGRQRGTPAGPAGVGVLPVQPRARGTRAWPSSSGAGRSPGSPQEKVEVLVVEGNILLSLCRWDEAVEDWERALALAPPAGKDVLTQRIHLLRCRLFFTLGHYRLARQWAEKAAGQGYRQVAVPGHRLNAVASVAALIGDYADLRPLGRRMPGSRPVAGLRLPGAYPALLNQALVAQGGWDYQTAVRLIREAQALAAAAGRQRGRASGPRTCSATSRRRNRNANRALEHHRKALALVDEHRLAASERVRALTGIGMDLAVQGKAAEAQATLEETVRLSRRWSLKGSLAPSLFYLGWLHALSGREQDAARCLTECMRIAEEHGHIHFFSQEAKVAVPILALCDRVGAGAFVRREIVPLLPARLARYFEELAKGKTYPTDVPLGPPPAQGWARHCRRRSPADQVDAATLEGIEALTDREREVLKMIALGMSNKQIGAKLYISEKTVKTHANHVFRKLGVTSRLQATLAFQSYQRARRAGGAGRAKK